jgi:D-glycero-D-manno-heptose 1,7-bisphosphate phosphatase
MRFPEDRSEKVGAGSPALTETVFLDRDGVINRKPANGLYVTRWPEFVLLPGAATALRLLSSAGVRAVVVTNQRAVARGLMTSEELLDIHARMTSMLYARGAEIAAVYACEHEVDSCECRKPATGLFLRAKRDMPSIDFARSVVIGDSASDLEPGGALGCRLVLVGPKTRQRDELAKLRACGLDAVSAPSLTEAVAFVLESRAPA